jgi:putative ABC transport system permease protein
VTSDLRQACRLLLKAPIFSALVILVLAVGIGATSTIFSVVDAVVLKPLPYGDAPRLVAITSLARGEDDQASYPDLIDWREATRTLDAIAGYIGSEVTMTGRGDAVSLPVTATTADFFRLLDAEPLLGRTLAESDEANGAPAVAVIAESTWSSRFGRRPSIVGESVTLDGVPVTIVGVMPATFQFPLQAEPIEAWLPLQGLGLAAQMRDQRGAHFLETVGRLAPGATIPQAAAELATVAARLGAEYPDTNASRTTRITPLQEHLVGEYRLGLAMLLAAVTAVLLIACGNVANLLLARATVRSREMAIRAAVGASRARLVRQLLAESILLSAAAGAAGVVIAYWGVAMLAGMAGLLGIPRFGALVIDRNVLLFAAVVSVVTGILFGLAPAMQLSRTDAGEALRSSLRVTSRRAALTRHALVVAEVALSLVLLITGGLLMRSLAAVQRVDPGFVAERAVTTSLSLPETRYADANAQRRFYSDLLTELAAVPGVRAAGLSTTLPMSGNELGLGYRIEGRPETPGERLSAAYFAISPRYFEAMGIRLLQGRLFTARDNEDTPNVVIVSETMARRYWPQGDALGKRLTIGYNNTGPREIVGIVADVKNSGPWDEPEPSMYAPYPQTPWPFLSVAVRTTGDNATAAAAVRAAIVKLDPDQPIENVRTVTEYVAGVLAIPRFLTAMVGGFAAFALALAASGLFSVMAYSVAQRRRDIGIRMALGAQPSQVRALIVGQALRLGTTGLIVGLAGSLAAGRLLDELLFAGVTPTDPLTFAGVCLTLLAVLALAAYVPVQRAARVDPLVTLRAD